MASPEKLKLPLESEVTLCEAAPVSFTVTPEPVVEGLMVPEMLNVSLKFTPLTFALAIVTCLLVGLNTTFDFVGVTV